MTPLHSAAAHGNREIIALLSAGGAIRTALAKDGRTRPPIWLVITGRLRNCRRTGRVLTARP